MCFLSQQYSFVQNGSMIAEASLALPSFASPGPIRAIISQQKHCLLSSGPVCQVSYSLLFILYEAFHVKSFWPCWNSPTRRAACVFISQDDVDEKSAELRLANPPVQPWSPLTWVLLLIWHSTRLSCSIISLHPSFSITLLLKFENIIRIHSSSLICSRVSLIEIPNMNCKAYNVWWHMILNHLQLWCLCRLSGLWVTEEFLSSGTSAKRPFVFCSASPDRAWWRSWVTPAKEVSFVTTKVKAEKQNSMKGRSAGTWEGQRQCKEELFLKKKKKFLFSYCSWKGKSRDQCLVSSLTILREFFPDNSEMRLPMREHPLCLLLAPWHPQWPTCTAALGQNRIALGTENMSSEFGSSSSSIIRAVVPPHLFPILPPLC